MSSIIDIMENNVYSLRQAINISNIRKVMNQDQQSVVNLIKGMEETNKKTMELSLQPYKGSNIDIKL
ncbi:YjfB family protein [Caminicella sporogenes]|uniref:YjfB family protein n=1 Tax=Caminicella sporogenes TaxID=166485 RepID=UPI00253FBC75|nr:YjfB family protein [Caminicella sporogenes]WIF93904.1 YjfB family protein [Caminicella sporogenes]